MFPNLGFFNDSTSSIERKYMFYDSSKYFMLVSRALYFGKLKNTHWSRYRGFRLKLTTIKDCIYSVQTFTFKQDSITEKPINFSSLNGNRQGKSALALEHVIETTDTVDDSENWMQLSLVLDRLGLLIFIVALGCGCCFIFMGILRGD